jgi:hypothetical protein
MKTEQGDCHFAYAPTFAADRRRQCHLYVDECVTWPKRTSDIYEIASATLLTVETGVIGTLPPIRTITAICSLYSGSLKCSVGLLPSSTLVPIGHKLPPSGIPHFVELEDLETWELGILARALSLQPRTRAD